MALDSNFGSSISDVDSESSISSQSNSKEKQTWSNIWQYYHVLNKNKNCNKQEQLIYTYNIYNYYIIAISNFCLYYKKTHNTTIKISGEKIYYIK